MTGYNFYLKFLQKIQNHFTHDLDVRGIDVQYFIDRGLELYVDDLIKNYKGQEDIKRRLSSLFTYDTVSSSSGTGIYGGIQYDISGITDIRHILDEGILVGGIYTPVKPITHDYYNKQIRNPFKKPYGKVVWRVDLGDNIHELVIPTGSTSTTYSIKYIKTPSQIVISNNRDLL